MTSISAVPHQRADYALCLPSLAKIAVNRLTPTSPRLGI